MDLSDEPGMRAYADQRMHNHKQYNIQRGFSRTAIFNALDGSLEHPKASHMDLLQTHCYNRHTPAQGTMKALHGLVRQAGKLPLPHRHNELHHFEVAGRNGLMNSVMQK
ncbi:hypothetical protein AAF712_007817 [Marasmius tenuissimus]|uniref:Uncharacterized protein n=1 Tax=Marasmius tenuissimus TaxID=585030 RepID=A0ABR2ZTY4_9AGAR